MGSEEETGYMQETARQGNCNGRYISVCVMGKEEGEEMEKKGNEDHCDSGMGLDRGRGTRKWLPGGTGAGMADIMRLYNTCFNRNGDISKMTFLKKKN